MCLVLGTNPMTEHFEFVQVWAYEPKAERVRVCLPKWTEIACDRDYTVPRAEGVGKRERVMVSLPPLPPRLPLHPSPSLTHLPPRISPLCILTITFVVVVFSMFKQRQPDRGGHRGVRHVRSMRQHASSNTYEDCGITRHQMPQV